MTSQEVEDLTSLIYCMIRFYFEIEGKETKEEIQKHIKDLRHNLVTKKKDD